MDREEEASERLVAFHFKLIPFGCGWGGAVRLNSLSGFLQF